LSDPVSALIDAIGPYLDALDGPGTDAVRSGFSRHRSTAVRTVAGQANRVVNRHLAPALSAVEGWPDLTHAIAAAVPYLGWVTYDLYDRALIGDAFAEGHAFAKLIGPTGPAPAEEYELGLFLIAPGIFYRDHNHAAPELYAPLTGPHGWRFAPGDPLVWQPAHRPVWNEPFRPHAIMAGTVPFLCLYAWTADIAAPAAVIAADDWAALEG
jgi:hypothetical protein